MNRTTTTPTTTTAAIIIATVFALSSISPKPATASWHESPCTHGCNAVTCIIQHIEDFESLNDAACANYAPSSPAHGASSEATVTLCSRVDTIGALREVKTTLECAGGSCSIGGRIKCPSTTGYKDSPVSMVCPSKNGDIPKVFVGETNYFDGNGNPQAGGWVACYYNSGFKEAGCAEDGTVIYVSTF